MSELHPTGNHEERSASADRHERASIEPQRVLRFRDLLLLLGLLHAPRRFRACKSFARRDYSSWDPPALSTFKMDSVRSLCLLCESRPIKTIGLGIFERSGALVARFLYNFSLQTDPSFAAVEGVHEVLDPRQHAGRARRDVAGCGKL